MEEYRLVCELYAHEGPVRCLSLGPSGEIVSGSSADMPNIRRWRVTRGSSSGLPELFEEGSSVPHDHWVMALTHLPAGLPSQPMFPQGAIITGCKDSKIRVISPSGEVMFILEGHSKSVISFSWTATGQLLSGSWDGTAKIWDLASGGQCVATLEKHENAVNVLGLPNGQIITTSTGESVNSKPDNFFIRYWDASGRQIGKNIKDHQMPIKSICPLTAIEAYATSSNDGTVRIRSMELSASGEPVTLGVLCHPMDDDGTPTMVHQCAPLLSSSAPCDILSCAEDGSLIVWNSAQEMQQILPHPAAVWCALSVPDTDGDFVTGGQDGIIRMFSKNPALTQTMASLQLHDALLGSVQDVQNKRRKGPSEEELAKCPKWDQRGQRLGKKEGDVCLFNKDGVQIAAMWSADAATWIEVGAVTGSGDQGMVHGEHFDHVMPVEMDNAAGGTVTLQLGYNNGENPFVAAKRFVDQNQLGTHYTQQVADWILQRAGREAPTLGSGAGSGAASRGGASSSSSSSSSSNSSSSGSSSSSSSSSSVGSVFTFSTQSFCVHDDVPSLAAVEKVVNKFREFNTTGGPAASPELALTASELDSLDLMLRVLATTNQYHVSTLSAGQLGLLCKAAQWDAAMAFPAFDVARMVALHPAGSSALARLPVASALLARATTLALAQPSVLPTVLTALRLLGNAFRHEELRQRILQNGVFRIVDFFAAAACSDLASSKIAGTKLHRLALVNIAFNLAVHFSVVTTRKPEAAHALMGALAPCQELLRVVTANETESADVALRALQAQGMICKAWLMHGGELVSATRTGLSAAVAVALSNFASSSAVITCGGELRSLLQSN